VAAVERTPPRPGEIVWFRGRRGRLVAYRDELRARVRFEQEGESIVAATKLGRTRTESIALASVSR
jgi:hypothetical protein